MIKKKKKMAHLMVKEEHLLKEEQGAEYKQPTKTEEY